MASGREGVDSTLLPSILPILQCSPDVDLAYGYYVVRCCCDIITGPGAAMQWAASASLPSRFLLCLGKYLEATLAWFRSPLGLPGLPA